MKNKFIKSTVILLIGGFITKILGMVIKIVMSRMIGTEGLGLYMMILPTFSLAIIRLTSTYALSNTLFYDRLHK